MDVADLFSCMGLVPHGPVAWGTPVPERQPGIYVVTADGDRVVYIGRTERSLQRRIGQFYRHRYGRRSPHRGGQDVKLLSGKLLIYWVATADPVRTERDMLRAFMAQTGRFPFANRRAGTRDRGLSQTRLPAERLTSSQREEVDMASIQKVRLASGREVFVEVSDAPAEAGLEPVSRRGERAAELAAETFGQALGTIEEVAEEIHAALSRMMVKPRQVSVELGVKFTVSGGVIIAQGGAEANLKLTLGWTNDGPAPAATRDVEKGTVAVLKPE